jgi:hypothetical protein
MCDSPTKSVELFIKELAPHIQSMATAALPPDIQTIARLARRLSNRGIEKN